jgi:hypothetical protein
LPTSGNFTFGYIAAMVNSNGDPILTSAGVADYDTPSDTGAGAGGTGTTNDWEWTVGGPPPVVALGTTFGILSGDYILGQPYRTYSMQASGFVPAQ